MSGSSGIGYKADNSETDYSFVACSFRVSLPLTVAPIVAIIGDIMVNKLRAVVHALGGEQTLVRSLSSDRVLRDAIRGGLPYADVEELIRASVFIIKVMVV